jgi:transcriptional regulator of met regulon
MADGRGRLSSIDLLPDEAQDDIVWAMAELNQRKRSQADILFELNDRLAVKGCEAISKSAFNRKSMRVAAYSRRINESRALFEGIAPQFTPDKVDETNIVIGEMIKVLIAEMLDAEAGAFETKDAMHLASAYVKAIQGQNLSSERKRKLQAEFADKIGEAAKTVEKAKGITADTRKKIMEQLGIIQKAV